MKYYENQGKQGNISNTYESELLGIKFYFQERSKNILSLIKFKDCSNFLDIGTGVGYYILQASLRNRRGVNVSIDISRSYLKKAKRIARLNSIDNIFLFNADARKLPFMNNTFDLILCTEVLEHIPNYTRVLDEIQRVAKSGADIVISFPSKWSIDEILGQIKAKFTFYEHINVIPLKEFLLLSEKKNLEIIKIRYCCFCFHILSRILNHFPFLLPLIEHIENVIRKSPLLKYLCWCVIIYAKKR